MSEKVFDIFKFSSLLLLSFLPKACSNLLALHFVNSHVLATCDRPSPTVIMTANNDLFGIKQESLFGKQELLYSNEP